MGEQIYIDWVLGSRRTAWHAPWPRPSVQASRDPAAPAVAVRESEPQQRPARDQRSSTADLPPGATPFPAPSARLLRLDRLALELRVAHDQLARPMARAAAAFVAARGWRACGAARLEDHARERFGRSGRWVRQFAQLGHALERFPALARALTGDDGGAPLGAESARLVARLLAQRESRLGGPAGPPSVDGLAKEGDAECRDDALARWIARARQVTLRALRGEVMAALAAGGGGAGAAGQFAPGGSSATGSSAGATCAGPFPAEPLAAGPPPALGPEAEPGDEPRSFIEIRVPPAVSAAFEEVVDLYRSLAGRDGTLTEALEALLAESLAGPVVALRVGDAGGTPPADEPRSEDPGWLTGSSALGLARRASGIAGAPRCAGGGRPGRDARQARLDRAAGRRGHLPAAVEVDPEARLDDLLRRAETSLAEYRALAASAGHGGPLLVDDQLARLVALEDALMRR
ncbi:MAG: hypothetical protein MUE47_08085, partial [Acidobacteria bacterium]|nr:hypothetical protein [Acidobacteriota bacterium]